MSEFRSEEKQAGSLRRGVVLAKWEERIDDAQKRGPSDSALVSFLNHVEDRCCTSSAFLHLRRVAVACLLTPASVTDTLWSSIWREKEA